MRTLPLFSCFLAACASGADTGALDTGAVDTGTLDTSTDTDTANDSGTATLSYAADVQPIFDHACTGCHSSRSPSGGLDLQSGGYGSLVGQASAEARSVQLVAPGHSDQSYLVDKLTNTQGSVGGSGSKMPPSGTFPSADLATITAWIDQGAAP